MGEDGNPTAGQERRLELGQLVFAGNDLLDHDCFEAEDGLRVLALLLPNSDYPLGSGPYGDYSNEVFALRAYCWCDGERHTDGCPPNFEHYPSGLKINFYKHIGRGMSSNRPFDPEQWKLVLWDCLRSIDPQRQEGTSSVVV